MPDFYWSLNDVVDEIVAGLKARPALLDKQVADSWPGDEQQRECIWIEDVTATEDVAGMRTGPASYNETYSVFVICDALMEGGSGKAARDAVSVLVGEVFAYVSENKRPLAGKSHAMRIASWKYRSYVMPEGRGAAVRIEIKVSGRR